MTATPKRRRFSEAVVDVTKEELPTPPPTLAEEAAAVPTSAQPGDLRFLPVASLTESPTNPRKVFDADALAELVASVRAQGVLEPLLVRPVGDGWEVVAGARRLRAAQAAGVESVPAHVRPLTDAQAQEVQLVENLQRRDLSALEEGEGYRRLMREHGYSLQQLADRLGKPKSTVAGRAKLAELTGRPRQLVECGELSASLGELISRYPTEAVQVEALAALEECVLGAIESGELKDLPVALARRELQRVFSLKLATAPFDPKSDELLGTGGVEACTACPKRTGAQPEAFEDVKGDTCLDGVCWKKKVAAAAKLRKADYEAKGLQLVAGKTIFDAYAPTKTQLSYTAQQKYVRSNAKIEGDKKGRTWGQVAGDAVKTLVAEAPDATAVKLLDKAAVVEAVKKEDPKLAELLQHGTKSKKDQKWKERAAADKRERDTAELVLAKGWPMVLEKLPKRAFDVKLLRVLVYAVINDHTWELGVFAKERGLKDGAALAKWVAKANTAECVRLALEVGMMLAAHAEARGESQLFTAGAELAGVDVKRLRKEAAAAPAGACHVCGCTEEKGCEGGCDWTDETDKRLCTKCSPGEEY